MDRKTMNSITIKTLRWLSLTYDLTTWDTNLIEVIFKDSVSTSQKTHTNDILKTNKTHTNNIFKDKYLNPL